MMCFFIQLCRIIIQLYKKSLSQNNLKTIHLKIYQKNTSYNYYLNWTDASFYAFAHHVYLKQD